MHCGDNRTTRRARAGAHLGEGLVLADVGVADGAAGVLHRLLEVGPRDLGHLVYVVLHGVGVLQPRLLLLNVLRGDTARRAD
eukprot:9489440-Pyramimonas_sp.AAC.1